MEAVLGAVYLDQGLEVVRGFFIPLLENRFSEIFSGDVLKDPKTLLQELMQRHQFPLPHYHVVKEEGPDHVKRFHVEVRVRIRDKEHVCIEAGSSKKTAEIKAAETMYRQVSGLLGK